MTAKIWTALTYLVVGMVAFWLTSSSVQIERYSGRWEAGFPFIYVRDQTGSSPTTGWGRIDASDFFPPDVVGLLGNMLVYGVVVLTAWRIVQSLYTRRARPSLRYLLPLTGVAGIFFLGASAGYRPLPPYRAPTSTAVPAQVSALIRTWDGVDHTTRQGLSLQFQRNQVTLRTPNGELTGTYEWLAPDLISLHFAGYTIVGTVAPLPCTEVPTLFQADCQQRIMHGYPAPIAATSVSQTTVGGYPAPMPSTGTTAALYQGIDGVYQVVVTRTQLTLTAGTGAVQTFTATP